MAEMAGRALQYVPRPRGKLSLHSRTWEAASGGSSGRVWAWLDAIPYCPSLNIPRTGEMESVAIRWPRERLQLCRKMY